MFHTGSRVRVSLKKFRLDGGDNCSNKNDDLRIRNEYMDTHLYTCNAGFVKQGHLVRIICIIPINIIMTPEHLNPLLN